MPKLKISPGFQPKDDYLKDELKEIPNLNFIKAEQEWQEAFRKYQEEVKRICEKYGIIVIYPGADHA